MNPMQVLVGEIRNWDTNWDNPNSLKNLIQKFETDLQKTGLLRN